MDFIQSLGNHSKTIQMSLIQKQLNLLKKEIKIKATGKALDKLLLLLLNAMGLLFLVNKEYRKNIRDFTGSYVICTLDNTIDISVIFKKIPVFFTLRDGIEVKSTRVDNPTTTVTFRDGKAMADFLLSGDPLIFDIARASFVDGPGVRTTVFLKGCPLSCPWCHNPESQAYGAQEMFFRENCIRCGN